MARETTIIDIVNSEFTQVATGGDDYALQNTGSSPAVLVFSEGQPVVETKGHILNVGDMVNATLLGDGDIWAKSVSATGVIAKTIG